LHGFAAWRSQKPNENHVIIAITSAKVAVSVAAHKQFTALFEKEGKYLI